MIRWFTAGESHGQGLVIIMEGVPAALPISEEYIGTQLARRQRGYGRGGRQLIEQDWGPHYDRRPPRPDPGQSHRHDHREQGLGQLDRSHGRGVRGKPLPGGP